MVVALGMCGWYARVWVRRREERDQGMGEGNAREHRLNRARECGTARGENGKGRTQESGMAPGERVTGKVSEHTTNSARESGTARGGRNGTWRTQESGKAPEEQVRGKASKSARESGMAHGERNGKRENPGEWQGPWGKSQRRSE